jgi:hypothetical protein
MAQPVAPAGSLARGKSAGYDRTGRNRFVVPARDRLTDPQRFQCWTIDLTGNGQIVVGLKPANRFCCLWTDQAIDWPVIVTELRQLLLHGHNGVPRKRHFRWCGLSIGIVTGAIVIIIVVRIVEPIVRVVVRKGIEDKGISNKEISAEMSPEPKMIVVTEMIVAPRKVLSSLSYETVAGKTMTGEPSEMAAASKMATASTMPTTKTPGMAAPSSAVATASSTTCERSGGPERQNAA